MIIIRTDAVSALVKLGLLTVRRDEATGLSIINYTAKAQFVRGCFTAIPLLRDCRATVIDDAGSVIAKGFRKFFNLGEPDAPDTDYLTGIDEEPEVSHKLDGSLIIAWAHNGALKLASRGAFDSEQVRWAAEIWAEKYAHVDLRFGFTYCFELIHPSDRKVVDYKGERDLVLIGLVNVATGHEYARSEYALEARAVGLRVVQVEKPGNWASLSSIPFKNFEGYCLHWPHHGARVKLKLAAYTQAHRVRFGLNERAIWELLKGGEDPLSMLDGLDEGFTASVRKAVTALTTEHQEITATGSALAELARAAMVGLEGREARAAAARVIAGNGKASHLAFALLDGKPTDGIAWDLVEARTM